MPVGSGHEIKGHEIKGWCPGALRPMMSGDGYLVRVRPPLGRLSAAQVAGVAELSQQFGSGLIDLSARANLQLRGVSLDALGGLQGGLRELGLLDVDQAAEARRNVVVAPFWACGDDTHRIAVALQDALLAADDLDLPGKFGFAVDCGVAPVLTQVSADIRIERGRDGLICRADSAGEGCTVTVADAVSVALDMARWFQGSAEKRMARHLARVALPARFDGAVPLSGVAAKTRGLVGFAFGRVRAQTLGMLGAVRLTPWRMLLVEDGVVPDHPDMLRPDDPVLRVSACPGAPDCAQGLVGTRDVARALARALPPAVGLHVSGCAKGCAHPRPQDYTLTGQASGRFVLIRNGCAGDAPVRSDLDPVALTTAPQDLFKG